MSIRLDHTEPPATPENPNPPPPPPPAPAPDVVPVNDPLPPGHAEPVREPPMVRPPIAGRHAP